jgi:signal transduction histidine kinase
MDEAEAATTRAVLADGAGGDPETLGLPVLASLVRTSLDGVAVLDAERRYVYVNPAGCRILGAGRNELAGRPAPFIPTIRIGGSTPSMPDDARAASAVVPAKDGHRRELEWVESEFDVAARRWITVIFRDVTETQRKERRLAAFARTASSLAYAGSLQDVLNRVAAEVVHASGAVACAIVLVDAKTHAFRMAGTAGHREDYLQRLEECRRRGAPLISLQAFESRRPMVRSDLQQLIGEDPRFEPMYGPLREGGWRSAVAVPLLVRDEELGVFTTFYPEGVDPSDADVAFLTAMADQTAVAVDNARLFAELQGKAALEERHRLARELHDSVAQALFSMTLQTRAVELAVQQEGADPQGRVARGLAELRELTQGALAEMRALIFQLRPGALREEGLVAAVRKHAAAVAAREGIALRVHAEEDRLPLGEDVEEELFRVVREAVHNSVKHAHPAHIDIRLGEPTGEVGTLVVEVADDGAGFDPDVPHPGHLGLQSMRERAERLGGRLVVDSSPGGSTVRAVLPGILRQHAADSATTHPDDAVTTRRS